jgi:hypothetical protein
MIALAFLNGEKLWINRELLPAGRQGREPRKTKAKNKTVLGVC